MSIKEPPLCKVYIRFLDKEDGTVACKMVADPPRSEWDSDNLSSAQVLALLALGVALDAGEIQPKDETVTMWSDDMGNN